MLGSASLTRRDLADYDLSWTPRSRAARRAGRCTDERTIFDTLWNDRAPPGIEYTADLRSGPILRSALLGLPAHGVVGIADLSS